MISQLLDVEDEDLPSVEDLEEGGLRRVKHVGASRPFLVDPHFPAEGLLKIEGVDVAGVDEENILLTDAEVREVEVGVLLKGVSDLF